MTPHVQRAVRLGTLVAVSFTAAAAQDLPLSPARDAGQSVTPAFEGWYRNPDGTFSLSFGYFNRNERELVDIPVGPNNFIAPGNANQGQPTFFAPRRHWGVFVVVVPANFGDRSVVWTLIHRGDTVVIPGHLRPGWQIDALEGEAGSGNTPPQLRFEGGRNGAGPRGVTTGPIAASVGTPLAVTVWASDDGNARTSVAGAGRGNATVSLMWFKHQGPGTVSFAPEAPPVDRATGKATTTVTFSSPGRYMLRVRANDASGVASAGHAQCCWTNGYVVVEVGGRGSGVGGGGGGGATNRREKP
jgi:hypothetical protein